MRVLVTGATGLIGSALTPRLEAGGHEVLRLTRRAAPGPGWATWDPGAGHLDAAALAGVDAAVHLAGEPIAARWTARRKAALRASRVDATRLLAGALARSPRPPRVLVCASAVGFYGDRGQEELTEQSPPGTGFLADLCREWEGAARPAAEAGVRVVYLRTGIVLSARGGVLGRLLPLFRAGLGGTLGSGRQYMSWIGIEDLADAVLHTLGREDLAGPVNATAPHPVTNREFTYTLAGVLRRPALAPAPAFALRLAFGRMADEALLAGQRVLPTRLLASGFAFRHPRLEGALRAALASC